MSRRMRFGLFEFEPDTGVLSREGMPVRLQPQPGRVLAILVAHAGDVVTREALRHEVWNDGTFVDFERGLNFCVAQIRSALGDSAESPRFIETLPRRGYRFIAPVLQQGAGAANIEERPRPEHGAETARESGLESGFENSERRRPERGAKSPRESERGWGPASIDKSLPSAGKGQRATLLFHRRVSIAVLIPLAVVTAILVATAWRATPVDRRLRIAVVPFDNETGMEDFDRIARGVADATVARLATPDRVTAFSVIGNAAALHQPRAFRDLQRIGAELDADYIVLAQMKRDAAGVRLIAHLIRVDDQAHLWADTYDRPAFTLDAQSEIAESIAAAVAKALTTSPSHRT